MKLGKPLCLLPICLIALDFFLTLPSHAQPEQELQLQAGDILFQDLDCGPFCDAIEKVTDGVNGRDFSHCGILIKDKTGSWKILEAVQAGVALTPLHQFLSRTASEEITIGRLKQERQHLLTKALTIGKSLVGEPYDQVFDMENDAYYCSELVYEIFRKANAGQPIFNVYPMTYKDPDTGRTFPAWVQYFRELNAEIPEGKPGLNPGSLSRSKMLDILFLEKGDL